VSHDATHLTQDCRVPGIDDACYPTHRATDFIHVPALIRNCIIVLDPAMGCDQMTVNIH
jgi:hypothetical protein